MKPEDVKPQKGWLEAAEFSEIGYFLTAHEVGAIIKAAMTSVDVLRWDNRDSEKERWARRYAWAAKADELEKMK